MSVLSFATHTHTQCQRFCAHSFRVAPRMVHHFRRIEYDKANRPFIKTDAHERPVIVDGHYVPQVYDDWLVIGVLGQETWIGLPPMCER